MPAASIFSSSCSAAIPLLWVCIITNVMMHIAIIYIPNTIAVATGIALIVAA